MYILFLFFSFPISPMNFLLNPSGGVKKKKKKRGKLGICLSLRGPFQSHSRPHSDPTIK
jgi:hypothetical protein